MHHQPHISSSFVKFSLLPTELRLKIWHLAHDEFPGRIIQVAPRASLASQQFTIHTSSRPSPLLHTNIESRLEFLKTLISPFSQHLIQLISRAEKFLNRDMRSLLFDPRKDTLFLSDAYWDFLEFPYASLITLLQYLFSRNAGEVMASMCRLAIPRVTYTTGFISDLSDVSMDLPSNKHIRSFFPRLKTITLQYDVANEKLKRRGMVGFAKGCNGQSGEVSELMVCDLDDEITKVVPWFVAEHHGWCPGTILFDEERG